MESETPAMTITDQATLIPTRSATLEMTRMDLATLIHPTPMGQETKSRPIHMALETPIRTRMGNETLAMTTLAPATLIPTRSAILEMTRMDPATLIHPTPMGQETKIHPTPTAQAIPIRTRMENATLEMTPMGQAPKTLQTHMGQATLIHMVHQTATHPAVMATTTRTRTRIALQERSWRRPEASSRATSLRRRVMRSDPTPDR